MESVFIVEWYAKEREPVPIELIEAGDLNQIFGNMWGKYLKRYYDWSVDLMAELALMCVPNAEYKVRYYKEHMGA